MAIFYVLRLCSTSHYICCRHYPAVVSTLLQFIVGYNEEYFVFSAPSKSRSVKPSFLNSNYESKNSSVASDYEKCPKAV